MKRIRLLILIVLLGLLAALPRILQEVREPTVEGRVLWGRSANQWIEQLVDPVRDDGAVLGHVRQFLEAERDIGRARNALTLLGLEALPALKDALRDPRPSVRDSAAELLGRLGAAAASATPVLRKMAAQDEDLLVRTQAASALSALGPDGWTAYVELAQAGELPLGGVWIAQQPVPAQVREGLLAADGAWPIVWTAFMVPKAPSLPDEAPAFDAWLAAPPDLGNPAAPYMTQPLLHCGEAVRRYLGRYAAESPHAAGALTMLRSAGGPLDEHIDAVRTFLGDADAGIRAEAARTLIKRLEDHPRLLKPLRKRLAGGVPHERTQILFGIAHTPAAIPTFREDILKAMDDPEAGVRWGAVQAAAVGARTDSAWREVLVNRCEGEVDVVIDTLRGVRSDGPLTYPEGDPATRMVLEAAFARSREPAIHAEALNLLGKAPDLVPIFEKYVIRSLAMPSPIRERALYVLARVPDRLAAHADRLDELAAQGPGQWKPWHYGRLVGLAAQARKHEDQARAALFERIERTEQVPARQAIVTALEAIAPLRPEEAARVMAWLPIDVPDVQRARVRLMQLVLDARPEDPDAHTRALDALRICGQRARDIPEVRALARAIVTVVPDSVQRLEATLAPLLDRGKTSELSNEDQRQIRDVRLVQRILQLAKRL